ncbi:MAG: glycosyltransferase [Crocinitomicaceae bacterium]|nr:glycosyltransferase [Crocinitomicaceae bacterium]
MKPTFSVITVHFNQLPLLKSTVENIVSQQGFGEIIEYIIVDGLSMDGTIDYLHGLKAEKSIHRIIERDKGIYDAMNKGIKAATGEYIIFINAGDQLAESDTLVKIANAHKSFDVLYGDTEIAYETFTRFAHSKPLEKFWQSLPFVHQSVIVKREILLQNLFDLSYKFCSDYDQLSKLYADKIVFEKANQIISRITAGGASDVNAAEATREVFRISKKRFSPHCVSVFISEQK